MQAYLKIIFIYGAGITVYSYYSTKILILNKHTILQVFKINKSLC